MKTLMTLALALAPGLAIAEPLELVCRGTSVKTVEDSSTVTVRNEDGDSSRGSVSTTRRIRVDETYRIKLDGTGAGTIKIPGGAIPTLRSGGKDGWWQIADLALTDDQIAGTYRLNILNKGRFKIDRRTGEMDMTALGLTYSGMCEKAPEPSSERKF